ncbi:uncharacterized protein B0H18DRAFT_1004817 [Fomitopsis serialis]|uniref:uncharacterized protein n=1 Tax=Fomitopsis serialis TaxID=139415 RepID=UPI0020079A73|nr:uncharacterized protein B0H18DRAFT_1004817 [Neoantrodia serialis]KAH9926979.1 hypothetical protein B0H18DRAFT_1004817 [Neoantrodia serialis]
MSPPTTCSGPHAAIQYRLALELLLMIKENIAEHDIRTHVCFYTACPQFAELYGSTAERNALFKRACWLNGLGLSFEESNDMDDEWTNIAVHTIEVDGFCKHPQCGQARLDSNVEAMRSVGLDAPGMENGRLSLRPHEGWRTASAQTALDYIHFEVRGGIRHEVENAHLHPVSSIPSVATPRTCRIDRHPIVARSYATFPPVAQLHFEFMLYFPQIWIQQLRGVTVWNVQMQFIEALLDEPLYVSNLHEFLAEFGDMVPPQWSPLKVCKEIGTVRSIFNFVTIAKWSYTGKSSDGPVYEFCLRRLSRGS